MGVSEGALRSVAEQFQLAGLGSLPWEDAVQGMADLTGSKTGELIGLGADAAVRADAGVAHYRYGRGIAAVRLGREDEGRADMAAALTEDAQVAEDFEALGIRP